MHSQNTHTYSHTHTDTHLLRVRMPVLGLVCIELGVSGKPRDWESGIGFIFLGQGLKGVHFQVCRVGDAELVKYSGS